MKRELYEVTTLQEIVLLDVLSNFNGSENGDKKISFRIDTAYAHEEHYGNVVLRKMSILIVLQQN